MQCQKCFQINSIDSKFCTSCGVRFNVACPICGRDCLETSRFCGWCGAPRIENLDRSGSDAERKQATILFVDIVGSTALIADLDAESAKDRLEPLVKTLARAVRRFDGTVLCTLGDGLQAAFGVPNAKEGHALLACQAALAMQAEMGALADETEIRIGIHCGEVIASAFDTGSSVEQQVRGLTVHLASRLEQVSKPGGICISADVRKLVEAYCDTASAGVYTLKGIAGPVEVYCLNALKPAVNSEHFRVGGVGRLHGRSADLEVLQKALRNADQGSGGVIGITAPAGVGKSRLCFEFGEWCRARPVEVLEAQAHIFGKATPLRPVLEILRAFFRLAPMTDPAAARQRIGDKLLALDPSLADGLPVLAHFLNLADAAASGAPIDPVTLNARLRDIIGRMVRAAGRHTSAIIIEDLHWLDDASSDFVAALVEAVAGTAIVIVVTFRPPWSAQWMNLAHYRELQLAELPQDDTRRLVRDLIGDAPMLDQVFAHVAEQSGGNPFFAEELVLSLAQSGALSGSRGGYRLGPAGWQNPVLPATVEAVIGARIDCLTEQQKAVLQIGAVIGKEFSLPLVGAVAGIAEAALSHLFAQLCAAELIQPCTLEADASFAFRHPLIQEVTYAMQLRARRTKLHAKVATAIERSESGHRDEFAGLLAHHYEAAGLSLKAAMHLQRAARWVGRTNSAQALSDWKKVRLMMQGEPRSEANDQLRALAGGQLLTFGWREGMAVDEARIYAEEALQIARAAGNRKHEVMLLGGYGRIIAASGAADDYVKLVKEALALTDEHANPEGHLLLNGLLTQAYGRAGLLQQALEANDTALSAIDVPNEPNAGVILGLSVRQMVSFDVAHWVRCLRAQLLVRLGRFEEADAWLARLLQMDPSTTEPVNQFIPHVAATDLAWHRGNAALARWHANEVTGYAEKSAIPLILVEAFFGQGLAASTGGDYAGAEHHLRAALDLARKRKAGLENEARILAHLADACVRAGNKIQGARISAEARETARRRTDRFAECHGAIVGVIAVADDNRAKWRHEAAELLQHAEYLISVTGALVLGPMLRRAKLLVDASERPYS